jgi:hypothetical protein
VAEGEVDLIAGEGEGEGEVGLCVDGEDAALWYLEPVLIGIVNLEGEVAVGECLEVEH